MKKWISVDLMYYNFLGKELLKLTKRLIHIFLDTLIIIGPNTMIVPTIEIKAVTNEELKNK